MAYSAEVKEYAKQLYLTVGPEGDHRYSFKEIRDKICQEFVTVKKLKRQTIQQWANKKDEITGKSWADIWQKGQRHGVKEAIKEHEKRASEDEKIELQVDRITRDRANRAIMLGDLVETKLENKENIKSIDLKILQTSELIFNNLNLEGFEKEEGGLVEFAKVLEQSREKKE